MQSLRSDKSRLGSSKFFKAADPADTLGPVVARIAFIVPTLFIFIGMELERSWLYYPYFVTEWMINYSAGFLRRGMLGEIVWLLGAEFHVPPMSLVELLRLVTAIGFASVAGLLVFKNRNTVGWLGAIAILACPYFTFYLWSNTGSLDLFFVLITVAHLRLSQMDPAKYIRNSALLFATAGIFVALTHEAMLFICLPINVLIFWNACKQNRIQNSALVFAAPVAACLISLMFHGTPQQAQLIYHHWNSLGFNQPYQIGFEQIGLTSQQELWRVWHDFTWAGLGVWFFNAGFCLIPILYMLFHFWRQPKEGRKSLTLFLLIPFLFSLPLYAMGTDWDRWLTITVITGTLALLMKHPFDGSFRPRKAVTAGFLAWILIGFFVRPYQPFLPTHRFIAGAGTRMEEYLRGQVPR